MFNALEFAVYKQHKYNLKENKRCDSQENNTFFKLKKKPQKEVMFYIV